MSDQDTNWHVLTVTRGGKVSILRNLTKELARQTMQNLRRPGDRGNPWSDSAIHNEISRKLNPQNNYSYGFYTNDGDLEQITLLGPEEEMKTFKIWPKPDDYEERYARIEKEDTEEWQKRQQASTLRDQLAAKAIQEQPTGVTISQKSSDQSSASPRSGSSPILIKEPRSETNMTKFWMDLTSCFLPKKEL